MKLTIDDNSYIIVERKNIGNKPLLYMLKLIGKNREYVSSLFPTDRQNIFNFDYKGEKFTIDIVKAIIKKRQFKS
jgi:hypothetical protein